MDPKIIEFRKRKLTILFLFIISNSFSSSGIFFVFTVTLSNLHFDNLFMNDRLDIIVIFLTFTIECLNV